jgi:hypothetical protein
MNCNLEQEHASPKKREKNCKLQKHKLESKEGENLECLTLARSSTSP